MGGDGFAMFFVLVPRFYSDASGSALSLWARVAPVAVTLSVRQGPESSAICEKLSHQRMKVFSNGLLPSVYRLSTIVRLLGSVFPFERKILLTTSPFCQHLPGFIHMPLGFLPTGNLYSRDSVRYTCSCVTK